MNGVAYLNQAELQQAVREYVGSKGHQPTPEVVTFQVDTDDRTGTQTFSAKCPVSLEKKI